MTSSEYFYEGTPYSLDGNYGNFIGYRLPVSQIGTSLRPDTAAQIVEATNILNQGFKQIEVGAINSQILDQIPKQHFKEINRLTKLTGAKASLHAPIQDIEASGILGEGGGGGRFSELNREIVERKLKDTIDKAHEMNPDIATPVTIHSANMAGTQYIRGDVEKGEEKFKEHELVAVNQETGEVNRVFREELRAYPEAIATTGKPRKYSPSEQLETANNSQWINRVNELASFKKTTDEIISGFSSQPVIVNAIAREKTGEPVNLSREEANYVNQQISKADIFLQNTETSFRAMFEQAYKYSDDNTKKELKKLAEDWTKNISNYRSEDFAKNFIGKPLSAQAEMVQLRSNILDHALVKLDQIYDDPTNKRKSPQVFKPVEEFAMEKSAETFANVALHSYNKYHDKAPIVSIENLYTGMAFSKPEEFKKLVHTARDKFVEKAVKSGMNESEARRAAEQVIGVTWDVGHLNMLRKQGFKEEDLIEATKLLGKDIKHVHLTDNFGYNDSHLAPGMGNVPIKKHLEALEKAGVLGKNSDTMVINEIGGFINQFKQSPFPYMLEAFGAPVSVGGGYWNQAVWNTSGGYQQFPSALFPDYHFQNYGGLGFSSVPRELGGQMSSERSRFSGAQNS
ncbi:hypothetical protein J4477_01520 [Candidatus Pacearchaeota archaeon]|nr:hypothetical protein [Candidatus Pacearchaeota archaeon]